MDLFNNDDYKFISNFVEEKIYMLKENGNFKKDYLKLTDVMDEFEKDLSGEQKEQFHELIELFYKTEEYYFAFSYSLGVKYGKILKNL